jgi:hypothetical protein
MPFTLRYLAFISLCLLFSCKKEVEKIVVQDRQYSWTSATPSTGLYNVFVGMGKGPDGLYLQQPGGFLALEQQQGGVAARQNLLAITADVNARVPIGSNFFVTFVDSLVTIIPNKYIVAGQYYRDIHLRRLDRRARLVPKGYYPYFKMGAINANSYLLFSYLTDDLFTDSQMHLLLAQVPPVNPGDLFPQPLPAPRVITIPIVGYNSYPSYPTLITAIDNYFLVDCGNQGVYRIEQNGTYRQVLNRAYGVETFYKWQGKVYAHTATSQLGISDDDGLTWQFKSGTSSILRFNSIHPVGDSLVGIYHGMSNNQLFTLKVNTTGYRVRTLKRDGLEKLEFTGLEVWRDTVYLATTGGLFKKSIKTFFEDQPD